MPRHRVKENTMSKIYYAVTPSFCNVTRYANEGDFEKVYDLVREITSSMGNEASHKEAENASSWCEVASIGEVYEFDNFTEAFTIEIIEDEE